MIKKCCACSSVVEVKIFFLTPRSRKSVFAALAPAPNNFLRYLEN
jgi:hypothetical protein